MTLTTRRISLVAALLVLFGGAIVSQFLSQQKAPPPKKAPTSIPARKIEIFKVENTSVRTNVELQGRVVAFDKIDIIAEVSGTLKSTSKPFKVGAFFTKGEPIIVVDDSEAKFNLLSQRSNLLNAISQMMPDLKIDYPESYPQWKTYLEQFDVEAFLKPLPKPVDQREKYLVASKNLLGQYYAIKSGEERLSKYTILAPFSGVVTQTAINPGGLVRPNQKLGELMNTANYELEATVPLSEIKYLKIGNPVTLNSPDINGAWSGTVTRVNNQVDPTTQSVKVYVGVNGPNLKEGMYLSGTVASNIIDNAVTIPREFLVNENELYLVNPKDSTLFLESVEIEKITANDIIVRGLTSGTLILGQSPIGAYPGEKILLEAN